MKSHLAFFVPAFSLIACVASVGPGYQTPVALLVITNQRTEDSHVYLQRGGRGKDRHLGLAHALSTDTLVLRDADITPGTSIGFVAMSFLTGATDQSDAITAERGVVYRWTLGPARGQQSNLWRSADDENDGDVLLGDSTVCRAPSCRSGAVRNRFMRLTGHPKGWPGHVVDHMHPLECGGADAVENMMWQTVEEAKAKDRIETQCGRWIPSARSDGKPVPHDSIP